MIYDSMIYMSKSWVVSYLWISYWTPDSRQFFFKKNSQTKLFNSTDVDVTWCSGKTKENSERSKTQHRQRHRRIWRFWRTPQISLWVTWAEARVSWNQKQNRVNSKCNVSLSTLVSHSPCFSFSILWICGVFSLFLECMAHNNSTIPPWTAGPLEVDNCQSENNTAE